LRFKNRGGAEAVKTFQAVGTLYSKGAVKTNLKTIIREKNSSELARPVPQQSFAVQILNKPES
jgi:hypothetical protein